MTEYDIAIVGAGPAGLAAAQRLSNTGYRGVLIERGRSITGRAKDTEAKLTQGHGGAGLYSDGKFSFFPSASTLWSLPNRNSLQGAYEWTCETLRSYGLDTPPFPPTPEAYAVGAGEWILKEYPSDYLPLEARIDLTANLVHTAKVDVFTETTVKAYTYSAARDTFQIELLQGASKPQILTARRVIVATGRFGPLGMKLSNQHSFRRLEVGFRIEQPEPHAFFGRMAQLDPKLKLQYDAQKVEWRTFCACRSGKTVFTRTHNLWTVSGHSDGPPTGRSNVGFNTRVLDEDLASQVVGPLLTALSNSESYFNLSLNDILSNEFAATNKLESVYGTQLKELMLQGLQRLISKFPVINHPDTRLIGPTLEGIGWYPTVDGDLKLSDAPLWVAGDACGLFRGIVSAFISGHYAANAVLAHLQEERI